MRGLGIDHVKKNMHGEYTSHTHIDRHTDTATLRLNWSSGPIQ